MIPFCNKNENWILLNELFNSCLPAFASGTYTSAYVESSAYVVVKNVIASYDYPFSCTCTTGFLSIACFLIRSKISVHCVFRHPVRELIH